MHGSSKLQILIFTYIWKKITAILNVKNLFKFLVHFMQYNFSKILVYCKELTFSIVWLSNTKSDCRIFFFTLENGAAFWIEWQDCHWHFLLYYKRFCNWVLCSLCQSCAPQLCWLCNCQNCESAWPWCLKKYLFWNGNIQ